MMSRTGAVNLPIVLYLQQMRSIHPLLECDPIIPRPIIIYNRLTRHEAQPGVKDN